MLIIIMHNNQQYLEALVQVARKENINDTTIIKEKNIGTRLIGGEASFIVSRGRMLDVYDKALVVVVKGEEKTKRFLDLIEDDSYLEVLNIQDKGFICAVPFHYIKRVELESAPKNEEELKMKITDFLKEDKILLNLKALNKEDAIKEIASTLEDSNYVFDFKLFLEEVFKREALNTTGIGAGIAIPHARTNAVKEFTIALGRSSQGVGFNSLDNKPAKLIFLMGTPKEKGLSGYLQILACLTRLLKKEDFKKALLDASTPKEVIEAFRKVNS